MSDLIHDPYAGIDSEEERQAIYHDLLEKHELDVQEDERKRKIYDDLMVDWKLQRSYQKDIDHRTHKSVLTIASGSFGVSFAFISQVVNLNEANYLSMLIISWACFGVAIILSILELKTGSVVQDIILDSIEENLRRGYAGEPYIEPNRRLVMWPERILSWLSVVSLIGGVVCLLCFVYLNMVGR